MRGIARLTQRIDDGLNPIVVKELRQAVHGKFIVGLLFVFLLVSLAVMALGLFAASERKGHLSAGRDVLLSLHGILQGTCVLVLPLYAAVRLASERSDTNVDLLFITTVPARAIIWGKFLVTVILAILIYSAFMPFMTLTFLLRGVDLPTVFGLLASGLLVVTASIQWAIFLASVTTHRGFRLLLGVFLLASLGTVLWTTLGWTSSSVRFGRTILGLSGIREAAAMALGVWFTVVLCLFVWSTALVKPPSANRALPVRGTMTAVWLAWGAVAGLLVYCGRPQEFLGLWGVGSAFLFGLGILTAVCERETWGPRVRRTIPRQRWRRWLAFLFYSGSAGGVLWASLLAALSIGTVLLWGSLKSLGGGYDELLEIACGTFLCFYAYAMTALLIRRTLLKRVLQGIHTWVLAIVVAALSFVLPCLLAFFLVGADRLGDHRWWLLLSPFALDARDYERLRAIYVLSAWAAAITAAHVFWFVRQVRDFGRALVPGGARDSN